MKLDCTEFEAKMKKSVSAYKSALADIRAGRANPGLLDKIDVDYYGAPTKINQMAEVKVSDARTIVITPWDGSTMKKIEKAILASDLGITPQNDGKVIRLSFPQLTEERRRELVKQCKGFAEETRVAIRAARRDANSAIEKQKKDSEISEDDAKRAEAEIQKLTDKYIADVDVVFKKKEDEVMEI